MARNAANAYGRDVRCVRDADELLSSVEGVDVVRQHAIHRLTTDNILGDDGTGSFVITGWGFDCRRLLGMPSDQLAIMQPALAEVLQRDPRVLTADVRLTATRRNGVDDVMLRATCTTDFGPFEIVKPISELTAEDLVGS